MPSALSNVVAPLLSKKAAIPNSAKFDFSNLSYQDLLDNNPYRNVDYRQSPWQKFLSNLGFRTNYDAYKESLALQAREYDSEVINKAYNEQYETPAAEAARMRQAGQNPDLLGTQGVNGASAPDISDDNPPVSPESDAASFEPVYQFANVCMSALTLGMSFCKDAASLVNMGIVNRAGELANVSKVSEFSDYVAKNFFASPEIWNGTSYDPDTGEEMPFKLQAAHDYFNQYKGTIPRKYLKQFNRNLASAMFSYSTDNERYRTAAEYLTNKEKYNRLRKSPIFASGQTDEAIGAVVEPLSKLAFEVEKTELQFKKNMAEFNRDLYDPAKRDSGLALNPAIQAASQNNQNAYNRDYWYAKDSVATAESENQSALAVGAAARFEREVDSAYRDIISNLYRLYESGNPIAMKLLLGFTLVRFGSKSGLGSLLGNVLSSGIL